MNDTNMNSKQIIFMLALQRYLSFPDLITYLAAKPNDMLEVMNIFGRGYPNASQYCENIFLKKFILPAEVITFIYKNTDKVNFESVLKTFSLEESTLVNMLYFYSHRYPEIFNVIALNEGLHADLRDKFTKISIDRVSSNVRLFRNNPQNTKKLIQLSKNKSIEEISLIFCCSPQIVEDELVYLGVGGFWDNENIRINYPFFVDNLGNKFSKSELIYIANNPNAKVLHKKMSTTKENIKDAIFLINKIGLSPNDFSKLIISKKPICNNWIYMERLLSLEKENKEFLFDFNLISVLSEGDKKALSREIDRIETNISFIHQKILGFKRRYLLRTKDLTIITNVVFQTADFAVIDKNGEKHIINSDDIVLFKKIREGK